MGPFFWRHLALLLGVAANFVLSVGLARRAWRSSGFSSLLSGVIVRSATMAYGTVSLILLLVGAALFVDLETGDYAAKCWAVHRAWPKIQPGMTPLRVVEILGQPSEVRFDEIYIYRFHPLSARFDGSIAFDRPLANSTAAKVKDRRPEAPPDWLPPGALDEFYSEISNWAFIASGLGLLALTVVSIIPIPFRKRGGGWMLYTPVACLILGTVYEATVGVGWRFDFFLLVPIYVVIWGSWLLRMWLNRRS
jgi:hypothetical protein